MHDGRTTLTPSKDHYYGTEPQSCFFYTGGDLQESEVHDVAATWTGWSREGKRAKKSEIHPSHSVFRLLHSAR